MCDDLLERFDAAGIEPIFLSREERQHLWELFDSNRREKLHPDQVMMSLIFTADQLERDTSVDFIMRTVKEAMAKTDEQFGVVTGKEGTGGDKR